MVERGLARKGLAEGGHGHSRQGAGRLTLHFDRLFERQRIHHSCQHANGIGAGAFNALIGALNAAKEITAANNHANFSAKISCSREIFGNALKCWLMQSVGERAHQRLA